MPGMFSGGGLAQCMAAGFGVLLALVCSAFNPFASLR